MTPIDASARAQRARVPRPSRSACPDASPPPPPAVEPPLPEPSGRPASAALLGTVAGPLAGALLAGALAAPAGTGLEAGLVVLVAFLAGGLLSNRGVAEWAALLPLMSVAVRAVGPLAGVVALSVLDAAVGMPGLGPAGLLAVGAAALVVDAAAHLLPRPSAGARASVRVAVIGSPLSADALARELMVARSPRYRVMGRIAPPSEAPGARGEDVATLGPLDELGRLVEQYGIDLLLMTGEVPRLAVFDEIARSCLHLPVRLRELSGFYEDAFGHVPVGEINASWFQYIMHPRYRATSPWTKRALDVVVAGAAGVVFLPLLALFALLIKRDGGSVFFKQVRIGEGGRPFTLYKLRTMREGSASAWAAADDARVTPVGRILRRTHLDEMPQLLNILRGEMSVVGPRPEQPGFVEELERVIPFYSRRHLVKPGLTGWAQVRCGYAGSQVGSAWKVAHDLFYLKHRSFLLDLVILGETLRTLLADPQYTVEPEGVTFILGRQQAAPSGPGLAPVSRPAPAPAAAA